MRRRKLLWSGQVAALCGVTVAAVNKWIRSGGLPASRTPGGQYRVRPDELVRFLEARGALVPPELIERSNRALVIADDDEVVGTVSLVFSQCCPQWKIITARSGYEAGKLLQTSTPGVVIVDLDMPTIDGLAVCRDAKSAPRSSGRRILAMTGSACEETRQSALHAGADWLLGEHPSSGQIATALKALLPPTPTDGRPEPMAARRSVGEGPLPWGRDVSVRNGLPAG